MHRNQYLISTVPLPGASSLVAHRFHGLNIYRHPVLDLTLASHGIVELCLLGYVLDPLHPEWTNEEVLDRLAEQSAGRGDLIAGVQPLSGRFVLLYWNSADLLALTDACGLRQMYYGASGEEFVFTSSERMFADLHGGQPVISAPKMDLLRRPEYCESELSWFGSRGIDDRLSKLLPNHYLDISRREALRMPFAPLPRMNREQTIRYVGDMLRGSSAAIVRRFDVIQALTAGCDSRLILAASREQSPRIQYYTFDHARFAELSFSEADATVPRRLASHLGLQFDVFQPCELRPEFAEALGRESLFAQSQQKWADIQYHADHHASGRTVRVNGNGGGIVKCAYGYTSFPVSAKMLASLAEYAGRNAYINHEIKLWLDGARSHARACGLSPLDLFYWEQKTAHWGATFAFHQDIAIEEFSPLYNRNLLLAALHVPPRERCAPGYAFWRSVIEYLWPEVLDEPINPCGPLKRMKKRVRRHTLMRYLAAEMQRAWPGRKRTDSPR